MFKFVKRVSIGAIILMIIPVLIWINNWQYHIEGDDFYLKFLYWLTKTVNLPWIILTNLLLLILFFWCLNYNIKLTLLLIIMFIIALFIGYNIKYIIKNLVQSPRPFLIWLDIYNDLYHQKYILPSWLQRQWQQETGFSFPSGHTIFVSNYVLIAVGLLWPRRNIIVTIILMVWASGIMISRIILGIHWPRDIIMGIIISWIVIVFTYWLMRDYIISLKL